eukprot:TRINITY_DN5968_c0_g1_i1.p1 TRINITY_DN5968_c0_g1~~TRINITY_DN5968_c0_g1_i1.p1  ORF type:complete len:284 (-),score=39.26 TRINITY_DN5968_c0_g1_i1:88-939(-)
MGCIGSRSSDGHKVTHMSQLNGGFTAGALPTSNDEEAWKESAWQDDTKEIWQREMRQLPVHIDLPRLCRKLYIFDNQNMVCGNNETATSNNEIRDLILRILLILSEYLDGDIKRDEVKARFEGYFVNQQDTGNISSGLSKFLNEVIGDNSKAGQVLKACHQKIIFPGFYLIKSKIYPQLPFRDVRSSWQVYINFHPDHVVIQHRKSQQDKGEAVEFQFEWQLEIVLNRDISDIIGVSAQVLSYTISDKVSPNRRQEIDSIFKNFTDGNHNNLNGEDDPKGKRE